RFPHHPPFPRPVELEDLDLPHRGEPGAQPASLLAAAPPGGPGVARPASGRTRRLPAGRRVHAGSSAGAEGARRAAATGARQSALRPADGHRSPRDRWAELRGDRVLARRCRRHRQVAAHPRAAGPAPGPARGEDRMKPLTCTAARRRLQAFHDCELPVGEQIAVSSPLEWCDQCAELLEDLRSVGGLLQALAPGRAVLSRDEAAVFTSTVVSRAKAEEDASLFSTIRLMFEDMHLVYAGFGAATATAICLVITLGMMRFATTDRPDSLAAVMTVLATPLECESGNDITDASGCRARWNERFARANEWDEQEAVFALEAVVMQNGRLANLAVLRRARHSSALEDLQVIEDLLDVVSRSRLDPRLANRLATP